ncbi:MAG TPA: hypothetical protein VL283_02795 [Candidatus Baltobacteraceae bacterium]|nr:hypothetical protein [Candidatus Baltobacteraceae bacterium]
MGHALNAKIDIQRFLRDCPACGAPKGFVHLPGQDRSVRVTCRCETGRCPQCQRPLVMAPAPALEEDHGGVNLDTGWIRARCATCGPYYTHWN